jgi:hypothetical protein
VPSRFPCWFKLGHLIVYSTSPPYIQPRIFAAETGPTEECQLRHCAEPNLFSQPGFAKAIEQVFSVARKLEGFFGNNRLARELCARYGRDRSFAVLGQNRVFVLTMAAGSIVGSSIGGQLLGWVPSTLLLPVLAANLLASAVKVWRHT